MLLRDLPVGAKLTDFRRYFPWIVADQTQKVYPGTVLIADFLAEAGCFDAPEPGSRFDEIRQFGWNRYPLSNVHQWLNSGDEDWYAPMHDLDTPPDDAVIEPYLKKPGFLCGFSDVFRKTLAECDVTYAYQDDYFLVQHGTVRCKVFLPSRTELNAETRESVQEGCALTISECGRIYLSAAPDEELVRRHTLCGRTFDSSTNYPYWLRSVDFNRMSAVYFYGMDQAPYYEAAQGACGIRPMLALSPKTELASKPDTYGIYHIKE